jgi:hypothetical protein
MLGGCLLPLPIVSLALCILHLMGQPRLNHANVEQCLALLTALASGAPEYFWPSKISRVISRVVRLQSNQKTACKFLIGMPSNHDGATPPTKDGKET